jgi:hypothetical protein
VSSKSKILGHIKLATCVSATLLLAGCVGGQQPCEEILEVKRQHQECEQLRKIMGKSGYPQQALTAKKRYEESCINLRYYRDEYDTICKGNNKPIGAIEDDK